MKTIFRTIIAALAATLTLVSCAKDELAGKDSTNPQSEGIRTIAVSFGVPTRSSLVGLQPSFDEDDEILVAQDDGMVEPEVCRVRNVGGKKVISTKLKGDLTLVYPKNAAQMDKSNENIIYGVYVSPSQSGRFEDANICMTKISSTATSAKFENKVAILKFYVDESIGVTKLILSAEDDVYIANGSKSITVQAEDESLLRATGTPAPTLANTTDDSQHRICYVAVHPISSERMKVESWTMTQELSESNIVTRKYRFIELAAGDIANVFVPYYIKVQVSSDPEAYQYWGYCNVGAFLPEEPGLYFSWGEVKGHKADFSIKIEEEEEMGFIPDAFSQDFNVFYFDPTRYNSTTSNASRCFAECNAPFFYSSVETPEYSKYTKNNEVVLQSTDDAASVNWRGKWRMPSIDEFKTLINGTSTQASDTDHNNLKIKNSELLIPAAGTGGSEMLTLYVKNSDDKLYAGQYWTRNLHKTDKSDNAEAFAFILRMGIELEETDIARQNGLSIRPIYDPDLSENEQLTLTITAYPDNGTF